MGLTDEIMGMASDFGHAQYMSGSTHSVAWMREVVRTRKALRTRLTALETELEGYRKAETGPLFVGTPPRQGWTGGTVAASDAYVMTLNTALPEPVSLSSSGSALPCTSEYVNAQSGYDGETGR